MKKIILISCGSKKLDHKAKAIEMYIGPLFQYGLNFAKKMNPNEIYILSAKYGLLNLDQEISPYNQSLNEMSELERRTWAKSTISQLEEVSDLKSDQFIFLAGQNYRQHLIPRITNYTIPLIGMGIGEQLHYLKHIQLNKAL